MAGPTHRLRTACCSAPLISATNKWDTAMCLVVLCTVMRWWSMSVPVAFLFQVFFKCMWCVRGGFRGDTPCLLSLAPAATSTQWRSSRRWCLTSQRMYNPELLSLCPAFSDLCCCHLCTWVCFSFCTACSARSPSQHCWTADLNCVDHQVGVCLKSTPLLYGSVCD